MKTLNKYRTADDVIDDFVALKISGDDAQTELKKLGYSDDEIAKWYATGASPKLTKTKNLNQCLGCGKPTKNKQFCKPACRKMFNAWSKECSHPHSNRLSTRGLRA